MPVDSSRPFHTIRPSSVYPHARGAGDGSVLQRKGSEDGGGVVVCPHPWLSRHHVLGKPFRRQLPTTPRVARFSVERRAGGRELQSGAGKIHEAGSLLRRAARWRLPGHQVGEGKYPGRIESCDRMPVLGKNDSTGSLYALSLRPVVDGDDVRALHDARLQLGAAYRTDVWRTK